MKFISQKEDGTHIRDILSFLSNNFRTWMQNFFQKLMQGSIKAYIFLYRRMCDMYELGLKVRLLILYAMRGFLPNVLFLQVFTRFCPLAFSLKISLVQRYFFPFTNIFRHISFNLHKIIIIRIEYIDKKNVRRLINYFDDKTSLSSL